MSGFDRSMFAADSTELCSSDECAMKLRECIIGLGVGICDGDEFWLVSTSSTAQTKIVDCACDGRRLRRRRLACENGRVERCKSGKAVE